jgi:hypothetical protein
MRKKRNVLAVLVTLFAFMHIQCADELTTEVKPERVTITETMLKIEESSQIYHSQMMELQKLFDISPDAQDKFQEALILGKPLYYSYNEEGEFIYSAKHGAGGINVQNRLSVIRNGHNARKYHYLEKLVASDDRFEIYYAWEHTLFKMRNYWAVSVYDDNALLQKLSLLAQVEMTNERGVVNYILFYPFKDDEPMRWPTSTGVSDTFF